MKKQILTVTALVTGLIIGATALSALAADGSWNQAPNCTPPDCNTAAPLNVGTTTQTKVGALLVNTNTSGSAALTGLGVWGKSVFNNVIQIDDGSAAAGYVLQSTNASGTATWVSTTTLGLGGGGTTINNYNYTDTCRLIATTGLISPPTYQQITVPDECLNKTCSLFMPIYSNQQKQFGSVTDIKAASLMQFTNTNARNDKAAVASAWVKIAGSHSGAASAEYGKNGITNGDTNILDSNGGIVLEDDDNSGVTGTEVISSQWTLKDNDGDHSVDLYVCQ